MLVIDAMLSRIDAREGTATEHAKDAKGFSYNAITAKSAKQGVRN